MVEILLAVYNGEKYLRQQLESIDNQSYKNWKLVIRDDGSKDGSLIIAQHFKEKYSAGKVEIYQNETPTGSAKNNFLKLLKDADSDYVMFCDQDDVWHPRKIEYTLKAMKQLEMQTDKVPILIHSDLYVVNQSLEIISKSFRKYQNLPHKMKVNQLIVQNSVTGCTVMINRALLDKMKKVDCADKIVMHDYWAALIAGIFGKVLYIDKPLIKYRQHYDNSVGASNARSIKYLLTRFKAGKLQFRSRMQDSMKQIEYFCSVYAQELKHNSWENVLIEYGKLYNSTKFRKVAFYFRHHAFKCGIIRKVMQVIWS